MPTPEMATFHQPAPLDPLRIETALDGLWRDYRAQEGGELAARARLANLICYCETAEQGELASTAIAALNAVRPVRSIVVVAAPDVSDPPQAAVALQCALSAGSSVCYEEITLITPGDSVRALPSIIEALTVPDLPVYLWFAGDPPMGRPGIERILAVADRVVTDSQNFRDPLATLKRLAELATAFRGQCVFTEMTWTRLGTWREAVGQLFDPSDSREFLPRITEVKINSAHGAGEPSDRTILMTGWLAARLGWKPVAFDREACTARFESVNGHVDVHWIEGPPSARGHLLSVEMVAGEVTFCVRRDHNDPSGAIRSSIICTGDEQAGPAYHPVLWEIHELLCNALEIRTPFADWEDALSVIAGLAPD
jgi:glucose-6-phosphate dehydrogenase assembly protein OpcA